jgi:dihydroxyacid dehydratase/phosphogluconate dehydratase
MEFNTIAISDGITMGSEGMKTSLVSREVIADSIELVARGHMFDAMCTLCACDKTIPASAIALARLDRPGVLLYGGSIMAGTWRGKQVAVGDVYEAVGAAAAGKITDADLAELRRWRALARARAAASTPRTRCPWSWRSLGFRPSASTRSRRWIRRSTLRPGQWAAW